MNEVRATLTALALTLVGGALAGCTSHDGGQTSDSAQKFLDAAARTWSPDAQLVALGNRVAYGSLDGFGDGGSGGGSEGFPLDLELDRHLSMPPERVANPLNGVSSVWRGIYVSPSAKEFVVIDTDEPERKDWQVYELSPYVDLESLSARLAQSRELLVPLHAVMETLDAGRALEGADSMVVRSTLSLIAPVWRIEIKASSMQYVFTVNATSGQVIRALSCAADAVADCGDQFCVCLPPYPLPENQTVSGTAAGAARLCNPGVDACSGIEVVMRTPGRIIARVSWELRTSEFDVIVRDADGNLAGSSGSWLDAETSRATEVLVLDSGTYEVVVVPGTVGAGPWRLDLEFAYV